MYSSSDFDSSTLTGIGFFSVFFTIALITIGISLLFSLVLFLLEAFPTYSLAKKLNRPLAWLAWVPIFGSYFRLYVLSDMAGDKEFNVFNKFQIKSRPMSFLAYVGIKLFGTTIISSIIAVLTAIPVIGPIIGSISTLLLLIPAVVTAIMEYIYLKDVLDLFKEDKKANNTAAIVVTVLDAIITLGFARTIYLYTLLKCEPLTPEMPAEINVDAVPVTENTAE